jgi:HK97 family phage prohead protease
MPYFITDSAEGCSGWATVKEDGEVIGCHTTKDAAVEQMVAVSLAEGIEPGGERALPENYRPALAEDVPQGRACGNCAFYNEDNIQESADGVKAYCERWDDYVRGDHYCNAWQPHDEDEGEDDVEDEARILIDVPEYIQVAAEKGLTYQRNGYAGEGLTDQTIEEARQLRAGQVQDNKVTRMRAWILRHRQDWESVPRNNNADDPDFPGPGAVAAYLWGVDPTAENGTERVLEWADGVLAPLATDEERFDVKELETRALPMGEFTVADTEDGQKTFTGYAALFGAPSAGLPFTEVIAPGAFRRTLSRAAEGKKIISFLFGHDETRALATTASGRLALSEDERGLKVEARLDPADPDAAGVISKLTHEAAAMGMSFGFTIPKNGDEWDEDVRTLREVNLFEVSVLSAGQTPAYPATLGLTAVRKVAPRMGVDADRLISALESIKTAQPLSADEAEVIDTVREKLGPKRVATDPSVARARLLLSQMESESL